jgi:hypothetical protein
MLKNAPAEVLPAGVVNTLPATGMKDSVVVEVSARRPSRSLLDKTVKEVRNCCHGNALLGISLELYSDLCLPVMLIVHTELCIFTSRDGDLVLIVFSRSRKRKTHRFPTTFQPPLISVARNGNSHLPADLRETNARNAYLFEKPAYRC